MVRAIHDYLALRPQFASNDFREVCCARAVILAGNVSLALTPNMPAMIRASYDARLLRLPGPPPPECASNDPRVLRRRRAVMHASDDCQVLPHPNLRAVIHTCCDAREL